MAHYRLANMLALAAATSVAGLSPVAAAPPTTTAREDCGGDVSVRLFRDEAGTDLVDAFSFGTVPASFTTRSQANRSVTEITIPAAAGIGGVEVVGTETGLPYLFRLTISFDNTSPGRDGSWSRTRQDWLVTTTEGRLVSAFSGQSISAFIGSHVAFSRANGRSRGFFLAGEWRIGCGGALGAPTSVPLPEPGNPYPAGDGSDISYQIQTFYNGAFSATPRGLVPATTTGGTVDEDPAQAFVPGGPGTTFFDVVVPAGTTVVRFALFDEHTVGASDLDLYVYRDPGEANELFGVSTGVSAQEAVFFVEPTPGTYRVWVHGFSVESSPASFTLFQWLLGTADAGNMTVTAPNEVALDTFYTITISFDGLAPGTAYLGSVAYEVFQGIVPPTLVLVTTP